MEPTLVLTLTVNSFFDNFNRPSDKCEAGFLRVRMPMF
jgi:hypothetical protein